VFGKSIAYMKQHALNHLKENGTPYPEDSTKWVLTVPAIWADPAKSVMRAAAEMVGRMCYYLFVDVNYLRC